MLRQGHLLCWACGARATLCSFLWHFRACSRGEAQSAFTQQGAQSRSCGAASACQPPPGPEQHTSVSPFV